MLTAKELERYQPHLCLDSIGYQGQVRLKSAKVLCIGVGGLASTFLLYAASAGIGQIGIVDDDTVSLHNLTRQLLFTTEDIDKSKVQIAAARLRALNPTITIQPYDTRLDEKTGAALMSNYDVIVDCSDNFQTKLLLNDLCFNHRKIFATASAMGHQGQFAIFNGQDGPCYRCLFEMVDLPKPQSCHVSGVFSPMLAILGAYQVIEVVKCIIGITENFDRLIQVDALTLHQKIFVIKRNPGCGTEHRVAIRNNQASPVLKVLSSLGQIENYLLIDVSSYQEHEKQNFGGGCIPLDQLFQAVDNIPKDTKIVLYCQTGRRSKVAGQLLISNGFTEVYCLKQGDSD